jgi:transcription factor CON7
MKPGQGKPGGKSSKTYSFVALPGNAVKKRPRRRYDEIERLYRCR